MVDCLGMQVSCKPGQAAFTTRRFLKVSWIIIIVAVLLIALVGEPRQSINDQGTQEKLMIAFFVVGMAFVVLEDLLGVNKSAVMLIVSASMWAFLAAGFHPRESSENHAALREELGHGLRDVGSIILFLLPSMGLVESIDHFDGFAVVTRLICKCTQEREGALLPTLCLLTFFLSAIIDNLTATIVSLKLLRHVAGSDRNLCQAIGGAIVIAANAGGAWSPVGDVTTTMLWLAGKISVAKTVLWLFFPSFVTAIVPMMGIRWELQRHSRQKEAVAKQSVPDARRVSSSADSDSSQTENSADSFKARPELPEVTRANVFVLALGLSCILLVPVLKTVTGLPPYLGMLLALGVLWFTTDTAKFHSLARAPPQEAVDLEARGAQRAPAPASSQVEAAPRGEASEPRSVVEALHKMDLTGVLFFVGVLLAVGALDSAGVLDSYAEWLVELCAGSPLVICSLLGLSSAVVDNVPLVEASIDMFEDSVPPDDALWQLTALAAGTGGSILSIGSIAGVTLMSMEGVGYLWYCRRISLWAVLGFAAGNGTYQLERVVFA